MVSPNGTIVDVHPTEALASVYVGDETIDPLDAGDATRRHAAASAALTTVVDDRLFDIVAVEDFVFCTYGDTIDELRDYIARTWRSSRIGDRTAERARKTLAAARQGVRPRVVEQIRLTSLRPTV